MKTKIKEHAGLDWTYKFEDNEWFIWTPDDTGAVIGSGMTKEGALRDAQHNLLCALIDMLCNPENREE